MERWQKVISSLVLMKKNKKQKFLDISFSNREKQLHHFTAIEKPGQFNATLFSRGKKSSKFFTEDSKLYITPKEFVAMRNGVKLDRRIGKWDSLSWRIENNFVRQMPSQTSILLDLLEERRATLQESVDAASQTFASHFSLVRLWNLSIVGSILFGMVTMTFIYRYLGQGAAADQLPQQKTSIEISQNSALESGKVLGAQTTGDAQAFAQQVLAIEKANDKKALEKEIRTMVKGHPIETMAPYIAKKDPLVAAFIVAIAKKESGWGEHHPVLNGQDCYNYWGYRGQRKLMGTGGHTCFNSPQDAVDTVAKRLDTLINIHGKNTPAKMVNTWKCGTSCEGDAGAPKWVSDVDNIFEKFNVQ
jgi:hypothetical protein